ncbi:hypothetical protein BS50DRAFT_623164 [Corynespora cassiicola Philippines]|uniref:Uncharacterized protein n=1 Tax=Corynespora cassiicola Philippines TaxID=1448308 RepID=A0A2T2NGZ2_CORCC|nr:hypothetical protein BS50DRAFT_623164 [Corynespora cassiicola Philippines]
MSCEATLDASFPDYCAPPNGSVCTIQPDPDIAGIGVIASFITIGLLVITLAFYQIWRNERDDFEWADLYQPIGWTRDFPMVKNGVRPTRPGIRDAQEYLAHLQDIREDRGHENALSVTIFSLADTQFVTGIAIAGAMSKKDITVAHFSIADELTWLGFISATVGLLATRFEILDKEKKNAKRLLRILVMWTHLGLMIQRAREFNDDLWWASKIHEDNSPTPYLKWDFSDPMNRASVFLLAWSILTAVIDTAFLYAPLALVTYYYAAKVVTQSFLYSRNNWKGRRCISSLLSRMIWAGIYIISLAAYNVFFDPFSANIGNLGFFIWGISEVLKERKIGQSCMNIQDRPKEDEMGFGQMVALILLLAPAINSADLWWGKYMIYSELRCLLTEKDSLSRRYRHYRQGSKVALVSPLDAR